MIALWPGFVLGLLGSLHCVGMCGAISLSLPLVKGDFSQLLFSRLLYNVGRIISYALLGLLIGLVGATLQLSKYQLATSIIIGVLMLVIAGFSIYLKRIPEGKIPIGYTKPIAKAISYFNTKKGNHIPLIVGMLNGFLPCGLVYIALIGAMATTSLQGSIGFMALFGAGTLPTMLITSVGISLVQLKWRQRLFRLAPYFIAFYGCLLVLRGMNLDIPYLSPKIDLTAPSEHCDQ